MGKLDEITSFASGKLPPHPVEYPMEPALVGLINELFKDESLREEFINAFHKFNDTMDEAQITLLTDLFGTFKKMR
jgi:hypothetical protein